MPKKDVIPFNILLEKNRWAKLTALARKLSISKSAVGRMAIDNAYAMILGGKAVCANGHNCFVPHMHQPDVDVPPPPDPDQVSQG